MRDETLVKVGVGLIGSQFISSIHARALQRVREADLIAAASPTSEHIETFGRQFEIPHTFTDYRRILDRPDIDVVAIGIPNDLHREVVVAAAQAGKHVIIEKPFALNLAEGREMIAACSTAGVKLMYAEELCFAPVYMAMKELVDRGGLGRVHMVKQSERHSGPHAAHFWDVERSGGGVMVDMGCHAIQFFRWIYDRAPVLSVYAHLGRYVHTDKTRGDDYGFLILEFDGNRAALAEEGWTRLGGMDDHAEIVGDAGNARANVHEDRSVKVFSTTGYDYSVEKAGSEIGWTGLAFEEEWSYGFPQEMQHFIECVAYDKPPLVTGEDGLAVTEILLAAYQSAATGRKITLPFETDATSPQALLDA